MAKKRRRRKSKRRHTKKRKRYVKRRRAPRRKRVRRRRRHAKRRRSKKRRRSSGRGRGKWRCWKCKVTNEGRKHCWSCGSPRAEAMVKGPLHRGRELRNGTRAVAEALRIARKPRPTRQTLAYGIPRV